MAHAVSFVKQKTGNMEFVPADKLPKNIKFVIVPWKDYKFTLKPFSNKFTLRISIVELWYKGELQDRSLGGKQIIYNDKALLGNNRMTSADVEIGLWHYIDDDMYGYEKGWDVPYSAYVGYKIFRGTKKDYLMFDDGDSILAANDKNELDTIGFLIRDYSPKQGIINPKISDNEYALMEDKYICNGYIETKWFKIPVYQEEINGKLVMSEKEFNIEQNEEWQKYIKECLELTLYNTPNIDNFKDSTKINISKSSNIIIIGIKLFKSDSPAGIIQMVHVNIDGKEGWIEPYGCHEIEEKW